MYPKSHLLFIIPFLLIFCLQSCKDQETSNGNKNSDSFFEKSVVDIESVKNSIKEQIGPNSSLLTDMLQKDSLTKPEFFSNAYSLNNYEPFWLQKTGLSNFSEIYLHELDSLQYDGLNPEDYNYSALLKKSNEVKNKKTQSTIDLTQFEMEMTHSFFKSAHDLVLGKLQGPEIYKDWKNKNDTLFNAASTLVKIMASSDFKTQFDSLRPNHVWYQKFRNEYLRLDQIEKNGGWRSITDLKDSIANGYSSESVRLLRQRLFKEIGLPSDTSSSLWQEDLQQALQKFQHAHQLKASGILDTSTLKRLNKGVSEKKNTLAINMERLRWMRQNFAQPFIWVVIPKMELDYYEKDSVQFNMRVVVGRTARPTPSLDSKIENIVFSPPWTVPPTIMKEEVVPGIARRGGSYLARRGLKAYRGGKLVNPSQINSKNYRMFSIGQAPGYRSSLGEVKFNMINPWAIYLHDTPHREDFVKSYRAYSSGCIRVHHPKEFAEFLLRDTSKYSFQKIDSICKKRQTIFVPMNRNINVHVVYLTNALDSVGNVMYLKDIYNWDEKMN